MLQAWEAKVGSVEGFGGQNWLSSKKQELEEVKVNESGKNEKRVSNMINADDN